MLEFTAHALNIQVNNTLFFWQYLRQNKQRLFFYFFLTKNNNKKNSKPTDLKMQWYQDRISLNVSYLYLVIIYKWVKQKTTPLS
jgi:hypothetical protein